MFIKFHTQLISMQKTIQAVYTKKGLLKLYKMSHQIGDCAGSMSARNVSKLQYVDHCTFKLANRLLVKLLRVLPSMFLTSFLQFLSITRDKDRGVLCT
jgi:hypothetical protein